MSYEMRFWLWRWWVWSYYFLTVGWLLLALVHNFFVGKIFAEVPVSSRIYFLLAVGGEAGLTEVCPNQTLLPPTSPPRADRKKYLPVRGNKTETVCFYFLTLLKIKSSSWLPLRYAGMCINFNTGNICRQFILFLIILCSVCAGEARSPGLLWLDNCSVQTNRQTSTALFLKSSCSPSLKNAMFCYWCKKDSSFLSLSLFSSQALDSTANKKTKQNNKTSMLKWTPAIQSK